MRGGALRVPREEGDLQKSHRISQEIVMESTRAPNILTETATPNHVRGRLPFA
jgi:hypothetical protein